MKNLSAVINSDAAKLMKKFDYLTKEQAKEIVRWSMNQYTSRRDLTGIVAEAIYGHCPKCGATGTTRERRPNGNDTCVNGCVYPSKSAVK